MEFKYGYDVIDEGIGVIHERIVKSEYINFIVQKYNLHVILEVGSSIGIEKGAGVGIDSIGLSIKCKDVVLMDFSKENLAIVKQVYQIMGLKDKLCLVKAHPSSMPFKSNAFDLVFNSYLVEFVSKPVECVREMRRVSCKLILLFDTNYLNVGHFIHKIYKGVIRAPWENGSAQSTTLWFLRKLIKTNGLKIIDSGAIDIPPWPSGVAIRKTADYKRMKELPIINPNTKPLTFKLLRLFYLFEKSMPKFIKVFQSHIVYVVAEKTLGDN